MRPLLSLVQPPILSAYLPPDDITPTALEDWELGGIGLSNGSQGLQVQTWHLLVHGTGPTTSVWVDAPNTPPTQLFALPNITWARLAFDQNMHPVVSYVAGGQAAFWWWDPTIPGQVFTNLPVTAISPCVTMDDKRMIQIVSGNSDVVLCYINGNNLVFRLQRDRYGTEYVWYTNITSFVSNPYVNRIGMTQGLRLLIEVRGALYQ